MADDRSTKEDEETEGELEVTPVPGGPFLLDGDVEIQTADGETAVRSRDASLCRCGATEDKPFCDGSHEELDFSTER